MSASSIVVNELQLTQPCVLFYIFSELSERADTDHCILSDFLGQSCATTAREKDSFFQIHM